MRPEAPSRGGIRTWVDQQWRRLRRWAYPKLQAPDVVPEADRERALEVLYRLVLGRPIDDAGRAHYLRLMRQEGVTLREIAVTLAVSDDLQDRLRRRLERRPFDPPSARPEGFVDVRQLIATRSPDELSAAAEQYFLRTRHEADTHHAKPFASIHDASYLLGEAGHLLAGLRLAPGMHVLDFGAGTGWLTRALTQLGCTVTAVDVSPTALALAGDLFARQPPVGTWVAPRFVVFDGHKLDLPAASFDRIVCFDALHHVPNPAAVLAEMARVLRPGGLAGFCEPGPHHSLGAQSQFEMKNHMVVENDIMLAEINTWAEAAGFTKLEVGIFNTDAHLLPLGEFDDLMAGGKQLDEYGDHLRAYLMGHQLFFLHRGAQETDSRERTALKASLAIELAAGGASPGNPIRGRATITNTGKGRWLPSDVDPGGVSLGVHLRTSAGETIELNFARFPLAGATSPGGSQIVEFVLPALAPGSYLVEFDLVSEHVAWFETNASPTVRLPIVIPNP